ncbi:MAG: histidine phosphotransferase [Parvibaculaceae bacterium]|nr:histidine phosphotransferase [Parvibaculaceae bacterium]
MTEPTKIDAAPSSSAPNDAEAPVSSSGDTVDATQAQPRGEELSALELGALLCSRVCHDVISPVGAISNGLEVLDEDDDAEMHVHAMDLIKQSAKQASAKLQFARLAFGAAGSAGAHLDLMDAKSVAEALLDCEKPEMNWSGPVVTLPKDMIKLLLNMIVIGISAIPRGGVIDVAITGAVERPTFVIKSTGRGARVPVEVAQFIHGRQNDDALDARAVQPYFTGLVARSIGYPVHVNMLDECFVFVAGPDS